MEIVLTYNNEFLSSIMPLSRNIAWDLCKSLETADSRSFRLVLTNEKEHGSPKSYHASQNNTFYNAMWSVFYYWNTSLRGTTELRPVNSRPETLVFRQPISCSTFYFLNACFLGCEREVHLDHKCHQCQC